MNKIIILFVFFVACVHPVHSLNIHVDNESEIASDGNDGSEKSPLKTINAAAEMAKKGDIVIVFPGVYREEIGIGKNGSGVSFVSKIKNAAVVTGADVWIPDWKFLSKKICESKIDHKFEKNVLNPFTNSSSANSKNTVKKIKPKVDDYYNVSIGMVWVDGEKLTQVGSIDDLSNNKKSWMVSDDGESLLFNCEENDLINKRFEISVRDKLFYPKWRGLSGVVIDGFIFENASNASPFPHVGMVSVRSGRNWIIRNNIIRGAASVGLDVGSEYWDGKYLNNTDDSQKKLILGGFHDVYKNEVYGNGLSGIAGWTSPGTRIHENIIRENNSNLNETNFGEVWEEAAGVKFHSFYGGKIYNNIIINNNSHGVWIDNGHRGSEIYNNLIIGSLGSGIFVELGNGLCNINNNVIAWTKRKSSFYRGDGIYSHDASDLVVSKNLFYKNSGAGFFSRLNSKRKIPGGQASAKDSVVKNNVFYSNGLSSVVVPEDGENSGNFNIEENISIDEERFKKISINFGSGIIDANNVSGDSSGFSTLNGLLVKLNINEDYIEYYLKNKNIISEISGKKYIWFFDLINNDRGIIKLHNLDYHRGR